MNQMNDENEAKELIMNYLRETYTDEEIDKMSLLCEIMCPQEEEN